VSKRAVIVCLDGCGPAYIRSSNVPSIRKLGAEGRYVNGDSMIPSVTNVNAVSILTGRYPEEHGITTNYYLERGTGREVYMESPDFIKARTLLEEGVNLGLRTALLTSKDKLRLLLGRGAAASFSAERPPSSLVKVLGPPPPIYSVDVDIWLMKALREVMLKDDLTLVYVMTTDYAMHKYAPREGESKRHLQGIDEALGQTIEDLEKRGDEVLVCVTADHGMSKKEKAVNLQLTLERHGIASRLNTIIADRYVAHHRNLGGAVYIYLENPDDSARCLKVLQEAEGVEAALTRDQASKLYHLDKDRIGDFLVLAEEEYVFGLLEQEVTEASLRSHGSLHEAQVPILVNRPESELRGPLRENKDLASLVLEWLTT